MKQITNAIDLAPTSEEGLLLAVPVEPGSTTYYVYVAEGEGGSCGAPWNALPEFEDEEAATISNEPGPGHLLSGRMVGIKNAPDPVRDPGRPAAWGGSGLWFWWLSRSAIASMIWRH